MCNSSAMLREETKKKKKLYLRSSDGVIMEAEESLMAESGFIRSFLTNNTNSNNDLLLELDNVNSHTLSLVMEFCRIPSNSNNQDPQFNQFFTTRVHTRQTLQSLMRAAERLEIERLLNLTRRINENLERQRVLADLGLIVLVIVGILCFILDCMMIYDHLHSHS